MNAEESETWYPWTIFFHNKIFSYYHFSDFEFQKRSGLRNGSQDPFATEAGGENRKRKRMGKVHGPMVRSRGEVTVNPRIKGSHTARRLSRKYDVPNFTTVRPFAYSTSPKTGNRLSDDNIHDIQKSFLYGEQKNAAF